MNAFNSLENQQKAEVIGTFYGYLQDVEANQNKFAGQITMKTVLEVFTKENPACVLSQHNIHVLDLSNTDCYQRIRSECYESVRPGRAK